MTLPAIGTLAGWDTLQWPPGIAPNDAPPAFLVCVHRAQRDYWLPAIGAIPHLALSRSGAHTYHPGEPCNAWSAQGVLDMQCEIIPVASEDEMQHQFPDRVPYGRPLTELTPDERRAFLAPEASTITTTHDSGAPVTFTVPVGSVSLVDRGFPAPEASSAQRGEEVYVAHVCAASGKLLPIPGPLCDACRPPACTGHFTLRDLCDALKRAESERAVLQAAAESLAAERDEAYASESRHVSALGQTVKRLEAELAEAREKLEKYDALATRIERSLTTDGASFAWRNSERWYVTEQLRMLAVSPQPTENAR